MLSVHAPLAAFLGQPDAGKHKRAVGMLDHTAGVAVACGAEIVVFHPGFLLGRTREEALDSVVEQLTALRERLEAKERVVAFGVEVMGRVRELGTADDVVRDLAPARLGAAGDRLRAPPRGHGRRRSPSADAFAEILAAADAVLEPGAPFHIHFSDIAYANRNETKHLPYGEGTLRAEPLAEALAPLRAPRDGHLRVAGSRERPGDPCDSGRRLSMAGHAG